MSRLEHILRLKDTIQALARKHNAGRLYLFGSCLRQEERPESDVDFVADFQKGSTLFNHAALELDLAELLGCQVDVVSLKRLQKNDAFSKAVVQEMLQLC